MRKKVNITLPLEKEEKAHRLGLNISKITENALDFIFNIMEANNYKTAPSLTPDSLAEKREWAEPDLNRRPFDYQSNAPAKLSYRPTRYLVK